MPFYGHGTDIYDHSTDFKNVKVPSGYTNCWDDEAKVPYVIDKNGRFVLSYDNARSIGLKCDYILEYGLLGAMFWDDAGDDGNHTLHKAIANKLFVESN
jgi:chitinase